MATSQLRYICGGVCGFEACLQEFLTEKELTMHCINEDETQVHAIRPFCAQCFMIFDDYDNPVVHQCELGKAQAQISMALSQCDTTIIDLTLGGQLGDELCSFRHEDWLLSKIPLQSDSSSDDGILDETVIPITAAGKKRKSMQDISSPEGRRKSPRIEAKRNQKPITEKSTRNKRDEQSKNKQIFNDTKTEPELDSTVISGSLGSKLPVISPIRFVPESTITSSVIKPNISITKMVSKQKKMRIVQPTNPVKCSSTQSIASILNKRIPTPPKPSVTTARSNQQEISTKPSDTQIHTRSVPQTEDSNQQKVLENTGIFWDIENIAIPPNISVSSLVRKIRNTFVGIDKREVEFMCVCDVHKENRQMIDELNSCNVTIVHVACFSKNAADERLKHYLYRFAQTYPPPSTVVVLSGDVNFAHVISNLSHFYTLQTVLIHNLQCSTVLKDSAHKSILFDEFIQGIGPPRRVTHNQPSFLLIDNLPRIAYGELYNRLDRLCDNTGGKIVNLDQMMGVIRFSTLELCIRAQKRLNNHYLRQGMCPIRARFSPDTIQTFR
ncbi:Meiosis arrest female protein 1-like [Oopsacas minuta]|uniref:Meiosis arrest female protein 1-like n=1 Tax=Oopsacas minuta TaxID=111878 RepID=A0AAV7JL20_9METZ|nr:Meiosis arrest female protein 1-like [Oopsacas minuta]